MKHFFLRIINLLIGLICYSVGIALTVKANIGYAPWDVFHAGLAGKISLSFGVTSIIVGIFIAIIVTVFGEKLGLGTILNMVLIGLFLDLIFLFIPVAANLIIGYIMLIAGLFIISLGAYFYIKSAFGAGPRDNLMVLLTRKTKLPAGLCRFFVELLATVTGWLLGGMVGIGTIISAIGIGFFIQLTFKIFKFDVTAVKHETLRDTFFALKRRYKEIE